MAGRHRTKSARRLSAALISAATATATALTVGVEPPPDPAKRQGAETVDLAAAIQLLPDSGQYPNPKNYPDLTGGLGAQVNDFSQALADQFARAVVNGISLTALAQAAGVDPQSLVDGLLADLPAGLVAPILAAITLDIPIIDGLADALGADTDTLELLTNALNLIGVDEVTDQTLTGLLALLGFELDDPFNLSNLLTQDLGVNLITAGPTFSVLKMLGLDLGWVPAQPNSVADEINDSPYLEVGVNGILEVVIATLENALEEDALDTLNLDFLEDLLGSLPIPIPLPPLPVEDIVEDLILDLAALITPVTAALPDVLHLRLTPTVGIGLGAFAAAMAYQQVIEDLPNQPGGSAYEDTPGNVNPILGSITILPLILINNPGRPDGGMFARFGPLAALFGIDTVNPRTEITSDGGEGPLSEIDLLGLTLTGANVVPILVDVAYEYQPLSDFAAWPNPVRNCQYLWIGVFQATSVPAC